jgi:hypothetical protein
VYQLDTEEINMGSTGPYSELNCQTVPDGKGGTQTIFKGATRNVPSESGTGTEFSGVVDGAGNVSGTYKETDNGQTTLLAGTNGTGMKKSGTLDYDFAQKAKKALEGPAKACAPKNVPWGPQG